MVAIVAVLAVLWPLGRELTEDSFPLSNFPMFTHDPPRTTGFARAIGVTVEGGDVVLSPELTGGTVEVIHAAQTVSTAIRRGEAAALCAEIAERVGRSDDAVIVDVVVVTDRFDIVEGLRSGDPEPVERVEHARCPVPRGAADT